MSTTTALPCAVNELVAHIVERFHPRCVIRFGSYASGTADEGSDVDLLVVMETPEPPLRQAAAIYRTLDHDIPIDILVRTPDQVAARNPRGLILRTILSEGVTVYEFEVGGSGRR